MDCRAAPFSRDDGGMPGLLSLLNDRLAAAFAAVAPEADPVVRPSDRADFQANGALPLAKKLGRKPREVAEEVVSGLKADPHLDEWCAGLEVAGPGFINVSVADAWISQLLEAQSTEPRLGVKAPEHPLRVVVDYASPNVAKEMHVGHLRSTIIGDSVVRLLGFLGHRVVGENHIGDWGTPFGMLIENLIDVGEEAGAETLSVGDLEGFYRQAREKFDSDPDFAERSRARVVSLQAGDPATMRLWNLHVSSSLNYIYEVLGHLGVLLTRDDVRGESSYNDMLAGVVEELSAKGLLKESDGALCAFPPGFTNREGNPLPLIVRKSDGGYGYPTTDLAALKERFSDRGDDLALYVVGAPQNQHLEMCFAVAQMAGWLKAPAEAVHVSFGSVLGTDRKMFKTREGTSIKLAELLDEAVDRAKAKVEENAARLPAPARAAESGTTEGLSHSEIDRLAAQVGIGAVKYADLSTDRTRDYVFDWERMLAFDGNTGPYVQYAHARIRSILRKVRSSGLAADPGPIALKEPAERSLGLALLDFDGAVRGAAESYSPHKLCGYLFDLAGTFTTFYEHCSVLRAPDEATRASRVALCEQTAAVLACGLGLLGIEAPDRM